jgi:hypothetical protein
MDACEVEEWRRIPEFSRYEISNLGRVKSHARGGSPRIMKSQRLNSRGDIGYRLIGLQGDDGKHHKKLVHRLVLETFIGPCPNGMECCHGDDDASNNVLSNLSWGTHKANMKAKDDNGRTPKGENSPGATLTEAQVREIKAVEKWEKGMQAEYARKFGVHDSAIYYVRTGRNWSHIK